MTLDGPFLCDVMCGKLAVYLRMCGHDTAYALDRGVESDDAVRELAREEGRTVLTRDEQLAASGDAVLLTHRDVEGQLRELGAVGLDLGLDDHSTHCGTCNGSVERVEPEEPTPDYAPDARETDVWRCRDCGQHFWQGSHWADVAARLDALSDHG